MICCGRVEWCRCLQTRSQNRLPQGNRSIVTQGGGISSLQFAIKIIHSLTPHRNPDRTCIVLSCWVSVCQVLSSCVVVGGFTIHSTWLLKNSFRNLKKNKCVNNFEMSCEAILAVSFPPPLLLFLFPSSVLLAFSYPSCPPPLLLIPKILPSPPISFFLAFAPTPSPRSRFPPLFLVKDVIFSEYNVDCVISSTHSVALFTHYLHTLTRARASYNTNTEDRRSLGLAGRD